jgi:hypothetical protein
MERSSQVFWGLLDFIVIGFSPRFSIYGRANFVDMEMRQALE